MTTFDDLKRNFVEGRVDRRDFIRRATAMGMAAAIPAGILAEEARASEPKRGGLFRSAVRGGATSDSLDGAALLDTHNIMTSWACRNNLTEVAPDGSIVGELAESWEASADAATWVFNLRNGVEFHNGKSLDADDVIFSINHHRGEDSTSGGSGAVASIDSIVADGKDKVVFNLSGGSADFPFLMADYHLTIVPGGTDAAGWESGIGTGPYILTAWEPGIRSAGTRDPNYFKEGRPYFDECETLNVGDTTARMTSLQTGEVDAMEEPELKVIDLLTEVPGLGVKEVGGTKHFTFPMHTDVAPFDSNDVRLALKYAVDREVILDTILRGHGYLGNDHPIGASQRYFAADLPIREYDPDKARHHLKKAGLDSLTIPLHAADIYAGGMDSALVYSESAAAAGITLEIVREPIDGYWSNVWMQKPFSVCYWGGRPTSDWMFSTAYAAGASWNDTNWQHHRFNELLVAARGELDDAKRQQMYRDMQQICRDEGGVVVPVFANWLLGVNDKVGTPERIAGNWPMDGDKAPERWWFAEGAA